MPIIQDNNLNNSAKNRQIPTIGFFISLFNSNYAYPMWRGVDKVMVQHGANIFVFCGYAFNTPNILERPRTIIYEYASPDVLDGLIIAGSLMAFDREQNYFSRFRAIPKVVMGEELDKIPCVIVDNESGFRKLLIHLIDGHGYTRLAYIGGPESNKDSEQRYRIYREVLAERSIPFDPSLVASGQFHQVDSGSKAIRVFLDERNVKFDAVIAANDVMALGAFQELRSRGVRVPDDIAITGFDDQEWAKYGNCPLTTVRQSGFDLGESSAELILSILRGETIPNKILIPTELVVRYSCGCFSKSVAQSEIKPLKLPMGNIASPDQKTDFKAARTRWSERIIPEMHRALNENTKGLKPDWAINLVDDFLKDIQSESREIFLRTLAFFMHQSITANKDVTVWQNVITIIQMYDLSVLGAKDIIIKAENLLHQARVLIGEVANQVECYQGYLISEKLDKVRLIIQAIESNFDLSGLIDTLYEHLPGLGIRNCYLSLYEGLEIPAAWSRLILAFNNEGRISIDPEGVRFPTCQIIPNSLFPKQRFSLGISPLFSGSEQLGFIVYDIDSNERYAFDRFANESLHGIIGGALKGAILMEQLLDKERQLEERTMALININKELNQFARLSSKGLQEPLQIVTEYLRRFEVHLKGRLDATADKYIGFAIDGASRLHILIENLLNYSWVCNLERKFEPVDFNKILTQVCSNLKTVIDEHHAKVTHDPMPVIVTDPGQMIHLMQNLISNAIKFHGDNPPEVHIGVSRHEDGWHFTIRDNGIGLDMKYSKRIFLIFQRLHSKREYPGAGIGLAVCKKIVERHGGRIWVESEPGKGAVFYFTIRTNR